jgi:GTP-binding protein HflX
MDGMQPRIDRDEMERPIRVWVSAQNAQGIDLLHQALIERLSQSIVKRRLKIPPRASHLRGVLYGLNCIASQEYDEQGDWVVDVRMPSADWQRLLKRENGKLDDLIVKH